MATLIARYFGMANADIGATATAEAAPANAMDCVKPFTIPDKWTEKQTPPWDANDTYDAFDNKGKPLANPDIYIPAYDSSGAPNPNYTGYKMFGTPNDVGTMLTIRAGTGNNIDAQLLLLALDDRQHGRKRLPFEHRQLQHDALPLGRPRWCRSPANMVGPTMQGITRPDRAGLRTRTGTPQRRRLRAVRSAITARASSRFRSTTRSTTTRASGNGRNADLKTANWICFFASGNNGNNINGIIVPCMGIYDKNGPAPNAALPKTIRLVQ